VNDATRLKTSHQLWTLNSLFIFRYRSEISYEISFWDTYPESEAHNVLLLTLINKGLRKNNLLTAACRECKQTRRYVRSYDSVADRRSNDLYVGDAERYRVQQGMTSGRRWCNESITQHVTGLSFSCQTVAAALDLQLARQWSHWSVIDDVCLFVLFRQMKRHAAFLHPTKPRLAFSSTYSLTVALPRQFNGGTLCSYRHTRWHAEHVTLYTVVGPVGTAGNAVALHCCNAHSKINRKFRPPQNRDTSKFHSEIWHTWLCQGHHPAGKFWSRSAR